MKVSTRDRQMRVRIAQEAARLIAEEGVQDFYAAKRKAAQRLGAPDTRNMPRNQEVEAALQAHQRLFQADSQTARLSELRRAAIEAMRFFQEFSPRLVGPVLSGTAGRHADINLHLFSDTAEEVNLFLLEAHIPFETVQRRFRFNHDEWLEYPAFRFLAGDCPVELVVFPREGRREAPRSPVDGRPMQRADVAQVEALLDQQA